jgi:endo-1,4-beta-xylanase
MSILRILRELINARLLVLPFILMPLLTGCSSAAGDSLQTAELKQGEVIVHGTVTDTESKPIEKAEIYISDANYKPVTRVNTNQSGNYQVSLTAGDYFHLYTGVLSQVNKYNFAYVPQTRGITPKAGADNRADFKLWPGATIVINAYDDNGNLIRNKRFREITGANSYATSLNNLPKYSSFEAIHDAISNWQWDQAIPAFVVIPNTLYKFNVNWEIEGFGKVILTIDNECVGYTCKLQSDRLELNFNYESAKSKMYALQADYLTLKGSGAVIPEDIVNKISQAESYLKSAEAFLAKKPAADMKSAVHDFNQCLRLAFWAHEEVNIEQAKYDINKYRKGDVRILVTDAGGKPIPDCRITYNQNSSDFLFGANPLGADGSYSQDYDVLLKSAGINYACITCRWGRLQPVSGLFDWDNIDNFQKLNTLHDDKYNLTGTLSLWTFRNPSVGYDFCPAYLDNMDFPQLQDAIYKYIYALSDRYKNKIDTWEMNELNLPWSNALNLTIDERVTLAETFCRAVKDANPRARVLMNSSALPFEYNLSDYYIFDNVPTPYFIDLLKLQKTPVDIIGLEFYYSGVTGENTSPAGLDMALIADLLDQYGQYNLPIYVEELSAPSKQLPGSAWWHSNWTEDTQAEFLMDFYTIAFSKPMVHAINWSWGVSDRESYMVYGGLLNKDLKPKKSYYALQQLLKSWKSNGSGKTDTNGKLGFRGYGGEYDIECTGTDGTVIKSTLHVYEQQENDLTLIIQ